MVATYGDPDSFGNATQASNFLRKFSTWATKPYGTPPAGLNVYQLKVTVNQNANFSVGPMDIKYLLIPLIFSN